MKTIIITVLAVLILFAPAMAATTISTTQEDYIVEIITKDNVYAVEKEDFEGLTTEGTEYRFKVNGKPVAIPYAQVKEITKTSAEDFFLILSKEDREEAFKRMRAISWENVPSTHSFDKNQLVRAVVEDDTYTYFAFVPGSVPIVYLHEDGIDWIVKSSYLEEVQATAIKKRADKWVVRVGDKFVCVDRESVV